MIHKSLKAGTQYYGVNTNHDKTHVLLVTGSRMDQVRVMLTPDEVDQIIEDLQGCKEKIK